MEIADFRNKIDEINKQLVSLLNQRASLALEIGKIKKLKGLPILDEDRENKVLVEVAKFTKENPHILSENSIKNIFRIIMEETRKVEV